MKKKEKIKILLLKITTTVLFVLFIIFFIEGFIHNHLIIDEVEKIVHERKLIRLAIVIGFVGVIHIFVMIKCDNIINKPKKNKKQ